MKSQPLLAGLLVASTALLAACASNPRTNTATKTEIPPALLAPDLARSVAIFRADGSPATWSDLLTAAQASEVVLFGEQHGHELGLSTAAALWRDLLTSPPAKTNGALALEFIERDDQSRLDDFLAGFSDEATFMRRTGRSGTGSTGGNWPAGHRDMVLAAKEARRPVIAANAPRPYVRLARTDGFEALATLTPEQARLVRVPAVLPTGRYRTDFGAFMQGDDTNPSPESIERTNAMFRSQSVWDWTMAESVNTSVLSGNRPTLLVVGQFHSDHDGGLVQALRHMRPGTSILTVSFLGQLSRTATSLPSEELNRASFIIGTGE